VVLESGIHFRFDNFSKVVKSYRLESRIHFRFDNFSKVVKSYRLESEKRHLEQAYRTISFPFAQFETPPLTMQVEWNLKDLLGYLSTWSSLKKFIRTNHYDPLPEIAKALQTIWSEEAALKTVQWELYL